MKIILFYLLLNLALGLINYVARSTYLGKLLPITIVQVPLMLTLYAPAFVMIAIACATSEEFRETFIQDWTTPPQR